MLFQNPSALNPKKNNPVGEIYTSAGNNPFSGNRIKSYSQSITLSQIEAGFQYTNTQTGETKHVPFSSNDKVQAASWNNLITRYVINGNTENLDDGEYTYRTYLKLGNEIIYSKQEYGFKVEHEKPLCPDNNHPHAIDLGIGVKFACCNVGASAPWEYGGYYAWGETSEKSEYSWQTYKYCDYDAYTNGKSWSDCFINIGGDIAGTQYDVAHVKWGGKWKMPTYQQLIKLCNNCTSTWTHVNGISGRKFVGPNGNSIFLPDAGFRWYGTMRGVGDGGSCWSSTQHPDNAGDAYYLTFGSGYPGWGSGYRYNGLSVRPVTE